jgi:ubiquitin-protein ligase
MTTDITISRIFLEYNQAKKDPDLLTSGYKFLGFTTDPDRLKNYPSIAIIDLEFTIINSTLSQESKYNLEIFFPESYPFKPPRIVFKPHFEHPLISKYTGALLCDLLGNNWTPACTFNLLLLSILPLFHD